MKKHDESCGKDVEKSNKVCKNWKRGHCNMDNQSGFSHVGHRNLPREEEEQNSLKTQLQCVAMAPPVVSWPGESVCSNTTIQTITTAGHRVGSNRCRMEDDKGADSEPTAIGL